MAERTYRREQLSRSLRIAAAADERRLSRRWAGESQYEMQLHYHRVAVRWARRRATRDGKAPIAGSDYTTVHVPSAAHGRLKHDPLWGELEGRIRIDVWAAEDGEPAPADLGRFQLGGPRGPARIRVGTLPDGTIGWIQAADEPTLEDARR